jgi:hypothetical protein
MADHRQLFDRLVRAMNALDYAELERLIHPDFVGEFPQSGERLRGVAGLRAQLQEYPGGPPRDAQTQAITFVGDDDRWVLSPGYTVVPLAQPDRFTTVTRQGYPDGSVWHVITVAELRDGMIWRSKVWFAPEYDPPEWRRGITEWYDRDQPASDA